MCVGYYCCRTSYEYGKLIYIILLDYIIFIIIILYYTVDNTLIVTHYMKNPISAGGYELQLQLNARLYSLVLSDRLKCASVVLFLITEVGSGAS